MGVVLHLVWKSVFPSQDGTFRDFKMDVDFICPMIPLRQAHQDVESRKKFLIIQKPLGWVEELAKIVDKEEIKTERYKNHRKSTLQVDCRLKLISQNMALSNNALPFLVEDHFLPTKNNITKSFPKTAN